MVGASSASSNEVRPNSGRCPREARGKRVRVRLENGMEPAGTWAADGKSECDWRLKGHPFAIAEYEVAD